MKLSLVFFIIMILLFLLFVSLTNYNYCLFDFMSAGFVGHPESETPKFFYKQAVRIFRQQKFVTCKSTQNPNYNFIISSNIFHGIHTLIMDYKSSFYNKK